MSDTYEVVIAIVRRLNNRGWHSPGCAIHPTYRTYAGVGSHGDEEPQIIEGKRCDCGAVELVDRTNRLLREIEPGQLDLDLETSAL